MPPGRRRPPIATTFWFTVGLMTGGVAISVCLATAGALVSGLDKSFGISAVAILGVCGAFRDAKLLRIPLPQASRQVPRSIFDAGLQVAALRFGFELGVGVRTYLTASTPYVLALGVLLLTDSWWHAVAAGVGFGLGRVYLPLLRLVSGDGQRWDAMLSRRLLWALPVGTALCTVTILAAAWQRVPGL